MPSSGWSTPTRAKSLISWTTSWLGWPVMAVLYLRGRLASSGSPMNRSASSCDQRRGVDDLVLGDAGHRRAEDDAGHVAAGLGGGQADAFEAAPDLGDVLDPDPVQLDVLAVGEVGGVPGEVHGDLADDAQLLGGERAAVDPDAQHEVLVFELVRLKGGGLAAVDPGLALGVEAPPAEPAVQVLCRRSSRTRPWRRWTRYARGRSGRCLPVSRFRWRSAGVVPSTFHCPCGLRPGAGRGVRGAWRRRGPRTLRLELYQSCIDCRSGPKAVTKGRKREVT